MNEKSIVCETLYYNVNQSNSPVYVRSTDGKMLENVNNKAIKEKRYFRNNECINVESNFNLRILYTINSYNNDDEEIKCPNCGNVGKAKDLINGCPYCHSDFNFGINDINISKREKIAKLTSKLFWEIYFTIISMLLFIDIFIFKFEFIIWIVLSVFIFGFMFVNYFIILGIKRYKDPEYMILSDEDQRVVWKSDKDENQFYNDVNKLIYNYLYSKQDLIDFDILENKGLNFLSDENIMISLLIREVFFNEKFIKETYNVNLRVKYIDSEIIKENYSVVRCPYCGASINIANSICEYCKRKVEYNKKWFIENIEEISN